VTFRYVTAFFLFLEIEARREAPGRAFVLFASLPLRLREANNTKTAPSPGAGSRFGEIKLFFSEIRTHGG
jgi:hypothetical protein